jgi:hypothetical protein
MDRRTQEGNSLLTVYDAEELRRVTFPEHPDRTFGFQEWKFWMPEDSWAPTRIGDGARLYSLVDAIRESKGGAEWLVSVMTAE